MARILNYNPATEKEPYSMGNHPKNSKWYIPIRPSDLKKHKNISTTNKLPPLTMGDRRWARKHVHKYGNDSNAFKKVLNAWNTRERTNVIKEAGARAGLPGPAVNIIAREATGNFYKYKSPPKEKGAAWEHYGDGKGAKRNKNAWMRNNLASNN